MGHHPRFRVPTFPIGYWDWSCDSPSIGSLLGMSRVQLPAMQRVVFKCSQFSGAKLRWMRDRADGLEQCLGTVQLSTHHRSSLKKNMFELTIQVLRWCC